MATSSADAQAAPGGIVRVWALSDDGRRLWFGVAGSADGSDPPVVELSEPEAFLTLGDDWMCRVHVGADGEPELIEAPEDLYPRAPAMWFVVVPEPGPPSATSLVAFVGHGVERGSLVTPHRVATLGVHSDEQVGAVRHYDETGKVDQVYVAPAWRRQQVATALVGVASVYNMVHDRPQTWGDGQRTALGEKWVQGLASRSRVADQTHLAPPMTPMDER